MKQFILKDLLYLLGNDGQLWTFYYAYPDMIGLAACMIGRKDEEKGKEIATDCDPELIKELHKYITKTGCWIKGNHLDMINLLSRMYNISEDEIKNCLDYNEIAIRVTGLVEKVVKYDTYRDCLSLLRQWDWDEDRVLKFMNSALNGRDNALVDIWPTEDDLKRPTWNTENFLLHKFHSNWGERLDKFIAEAIEKYPDPKDYDYAGYYVLEQFERR